MSGSRALTRRTVAVLPVADALDVGVGQVDDADRPRCRIQIVKGQGESGRLHHRGSTT